MHPNTSKIRHPGLDRLLGAGRSLIFVQTFEENRLGRILNDLADSYDRPYWTWQINTGLMVKGEAIPNTATPAQALEHLLESDANPIVWLKDFQPHLDIHTTRQLRDLYNKWRLVGGVAVISATSVQVPRDLEREVAIYHLEMPNQLELQAEVERWQKETGQTLPVTKEVIAATLKGLTLNEAWHALTRTQSAGQDNPHLLRMLQEEKRQLIQKAGTLEYIPEVPKIEQLGGLDNLKDWLSKRRTLLTASDKASREISPKGLLLMGVSGCGKSLCVKAISSAWQLPLYRLEMSRVFSGAYGSPEVAFADACRLMSEMAPAILWIDEIEMGLSAEGSTAADPVLSRVFAYFLTWMQEKPPGLFVAATANRIDLLPAEMIRKGRFDQVFFVDLPKTEERESIFRIHLENRAYDPEGFNLSIFADGTEGWSGAEIEQAVISAITIAKMEGRDLEIKDLYAARKQIVPISATMEQQVRHIRNWAYERAIPASK